MWAAAAIGAFCGADLLAEAAQLTVFVLAGNTLLRPLVNRINRLPFNERTSEARYQVHLTVSSDKTDQVRDALSDALDKASYPARSIHVYSRGERFVEIIATLVATAVDPREIDHISDELARRTDVAHATWSQRTMD